MLVAAGSGHGPAAALGGAALTTVYLLVHLLAPTAMGAGDVKPALGLGALTGWLGEDVWLLAGVAAPLLTAAMGLVARLCWSPKTVPQRPSMRVASGAAVGLAVL